MSSTTVGGNIWQGIELNYDQLIGTRCSPYWANLPYFSEGILTQLDF